MTQAVPQSQLLRFVGWFFGLHGFIFCLLGYHYLHITLQSSTLFQNLLVDFSNPLGKSIILIFTLVNYGSYMLLLNLFLSVIPLFFTLFLPRFWVVISIVIVTAFLGLCVFYIDIQAYSLYKFHVNKDVFALIFNPHILTFFDLTQQEMTRIIFSIITMISVEIILAWITWKGIIRSQRLKIGKTGVIIWMSASLFSYFTFMLMLCQHNNLLVQQTANLPFYNDLLTKLIPHRDAYQMMNRSSEAHYMQAPFSQKKMHYPLHTMRCQPNSHYNIVLIVVDSLRADALPDMPYTQVFARQNWQFQNHISGGNCTQSGLFSLYYSLPATYWTAALSQHVSPIWIDLLQKYHYDIRVISSSGLKQPPLDKTIFQKIQIAHTEGSHKTNQADRDRDVTRQAIGYLKQPHQKPFFLNILYNAPHAFCSAECFSPIYTPVQKQCSRLDMDEQTDRLPYYNNYRNTVDFIDKEIHRLLTSLEQQEYWDHTVVIITSDHGQEFNESQKNYWGHASNFSHYQIQTPLIIHWPQKSAQTVTYRTSSYDIVPTLLTRLWHCQNTSSDYSVGQDLFKEGNREQLIAVSYTNTAIIEANRLITLHASGEIDVTDAQLNPLPASTTDIPLYQALQIMRKYYKSD